MGSRRAKPQLKQRPTVCWAIAATDMQRLPGIQMPHMGVETILNVHAVHDQVKDGGSYHVAVLATSSLERHRRKIWPPWSGSGKFGSSSRTTTTINTEKVNKLWSVSIFILAAGLFERVCYCSFSSTQRYFLLKLGYSNAMATSLNAAFSTCVNLTTILGGWIADSHLGIRTSPVTGPLP